MNCLAVDTSGSHLTVVIVKGEEVFVKYIENCNLQHSVVLMPAIENLLEEAGLAVSDMDCFGCNVGPGSFTGIRIGVSTIKAFSYAFNKKVFGLTSFDVLAYNKKGGRNLAVIDARHDNYYACGYDGLNPLTSPTFASGEELNQLKSEFPYILTSSDIQLQNANCDVKQGFINAVLGKISTATTEKESLVPLYVRKSQAEENL